MRSKYTSWKVLKLFAIAAAAAILCSGLSKVAAEETIGERLAKIREQLRKRGEPIHIESPPQDNLESEEQNKLLSQWPNWANWANWSNWPNWANWPNF